MKTILYLILPFVITCTAEAQTVFQIGGRDNDYREFAIAGDWAAYTTRFPSDARFTVGRSDPAKDWPYVIPGPADAWAGNRPHTFRIYFRP